MFSISVRSRNMCRTLENSLISFFFSGTNPDSIHKAESDPPIAMDGHPVNRSITHGTVFNYQNPKNKYLGPVVIKIRHLRGANYSSYNASIRFSVSARCVLPCNLSVDFVLTFAFLFLLKGFPRHGNMPQVQISG